LGRSIYTVLTVVLASACLYLFACEPLEMFALAILLGLISGAYSSIFMSSVLWLSIRARGARAETVPAATDPYVATRRFLALLGMITAVGVGGWIAIPSLIPMKVEQVALADKLINGPLGDLSPFLHIASESLILAQRGDLKGAKARMKDLETAWDEAEERLQPMSPEDWTSVDKSIDRALAKVRAKEPDQEACVAALQTLVSKFSNLKKPK
jgi:hypothetical protein